MKTKTVLVLAIIAVAVLTTIGQVFFAKTGVSASLKYPSSVSQLNGNLFDPNSYYRLTNNWQGECRSLDIVNDGNNNRPILAKSGEVSGQNWKITLVSGTGYYRLTTQWQGDGRSLDFVKDEKNNQLMLVNNSLAYWKITPLGNNYFRLTPQWQSDKSLDIVNDGKNNQPILAATGNTSGQSWRISKVKVVTTLSASPGLNSFYKKYLDADGIPVVSSEKVPDAALYQVRFMTLQMLSKIPGALAEMKKRGARIAVMAKTEVTTDIPEHAFLKNDTKVDWNQRARGVGGTMEVPTSSCAEENVLCYEQDKYRGEDIFIHEFAHSIHNLGLIPAYPNFYRELNSVYVKATQQGLWPNTYAITNAHEYFAEGVQAWFNTNLEANPANGVHNYVNTRAELMAYDIALYNLLKKYFPEDENKCTCH